MSVNAKEKFANLKWEQLLAEKYFVESCFSRKSKSYPPKQQLTDLLMKIQSINYK